jgi:hypothetical protein
LIDITPPKLDRLRILAFEAHDLALAKLARNIQRDREDIAFLVQKGALKRGVLLERFEAELRPHLLNESREALTLELWLENLFPAEGRPAGGPVDP